MNHNLLTNLPAFLGADARGYIRLAGSRISLVDVIQAYNTGLAAEQIAEQFPTVSLAAVHHTLAFYLDHRDAVDAYLQQHIGEARARRTLHAPSEPMLLLRERARQLRAARMKAAHAPP